MNLVRQLEFLNPSTIDDTLHIIGLGAVGSHVATSLVRMGFDKFKLYDFDKVESHNIPNQVFNTADINSTKLEAVEKAMRKINPNIFVSTAIKGWLGQTLNGYVFMCVDSIDTRNSIREHCENNPYCKAMFDFRIGLTSAQHYAAARAKQAELKFMKDSMDFKAEEVKVPTTVCGSSLTVLPTIQTIVALGCANFINMIKEQPYHLMIDIDVFGPGLITL